MDLSRRDLIALGGMTLAGTAVAPMPLVPKDLVRPRPTFDIAKRRDIIHDIQRHLATQQDDVQMTSLSTSPAVSWTAWLER